jgi:hypothetical protein
MSTLLEQASLVMIPSGYKEDVVYSQIPTNGSGDLSFTRASNGTRINSAGLVEVCPWNLIDNSNNFSAGAWVLQEVTSTSGQTDPTGASNGWRFNETTATGQHRFYYSFIAFNTGVITQSIYVKSLGRDQIFIGANSNSENFIFTFSTETISSVTGFTSTSATNVGNGWYRLTATFIGFSPINCLFVQGYNGGLSYAGDTSKGFYAFGGQLNYGSTAKPYFPTTDRLNVPRLTYQNGGGGCPSLLLEKQSTNLCLYSEQFDNAAYNKISGGSATVPVVTANFATSPDGSQNADRIQFARTGTTASDFSAINQSSLTLSATGTTTIYLKSNTSSNQNVLMYWGGGQGQVFLVTPSWQRFTLSNLSVGTDAIVFGTRGGTGNFFNGGDLTLDILAWGAQLEQSSYPTSYIPTTSSSATRVADACFKTGISSLIGQTSGSVFFDFTVDSVTQPGDPVLWYMKDGGAGERYVELYSNGNLVYAEIDGSGPIATITKSSLTVGRHKCAIAYATNDFVFYVDGVQIGTDTSGTPNGFSTFGLQYYLSVYTGQQKVNQAAIFKTRLTNAELASLTTI